MAGNRDLCQAVADFYNTSFRRDKKSKYTRDNVSIASGGRLALTRLASALGQHQHGPFHPGLYGLRGIVKRVQGLQPIPILLDAEAGYKIPLPALKKEILGRGLSALLVSNPCNPTGQLIEEGELRAWCTLARECQCSLIMDEFYSHYIYDRSRARQNGFRRRIRRRCRNRPHYHCRWSDQELALPRLAHKLDARTESRD